MIEDAFNELTNNFNENEKSIRENKYVIHELKLYDFEEKIGRISLLGTMLFLPVWAHWLPRRGPVPSLGQAHMRT